MKHTKLSAMKWMAAGMILGAGFIGIQNLQKTKVYSNPIDWMIPDAEARKYINPATITFANPAGKGDFVRLMYFMVNGAPTGLGYTLPGPDGGFVGMIKQMTNKLGAALARAGYSTCEAIPVSGSTTETITKEGIAMTMRMAFGPGERRVPNGYVHATDLFEKRVSVFKGNDQVMAFEMTCANGSGVRTGYIVADKDMMKEPGREVKRNMEIYFQRDENTNASRVDMLQVAEGSDSNDEKMAVSFSTSDGDSFALYMVRTTSSGGDSFGIWGSRSSNKALMKSIHEVTTKNDETAIHGVGDQSGNPGMFSTCLDFSGVNAIEAPGSCPSPVANSSNAVFGGSTPLVWNIKNVGAVGTTITDLNP
jgi:hypothetical protein